MSGNGMRRNQQGADGPKDRTQLLKYAIFYLVVAAILFVTNQAAKNPIAGRNQSQSPVAVRLTWEAIHRGMNLSLEESALLGADYFGLVASSEDFRSGTKAFLEKTRPSFAGR